MPFINETGISRIFELVERNYAGKNSDGAVVSVGADYAEYADWNDGNTSNENRKGYFVTIVSGTNKITKANADSAIIGVTTDSAGFIGNYSAGAETNNAKGLIGIVGQISVIDNGNCTVGERCMPGDDGTAVPSENTCGYKVIERIDDSHVRIMVAPTIDMIQRIKIDVSELQILISNFKADIEASGTTNGAEWIKFKNGLAIVAKTYAYTNVPVKSAWGGMYYSAERAGMIYPFEFVSRPHIAFSFNTGGGAGYVAPIYGDKGTHDNTEKTWNYYLYCPVSTSFNYRISYLVFGRWK